MLATRHRIFWHGFQRYPPQTFPKLRRCRHQRECFYLQSADADCECNMSISMSDVFKGLRADVGHMHCRFLGRGK